MKTLLRFGALLLATTVSAKAECVSDLFGRTSISIFCPPPPPVALDDNYPRRVAHLVKRPKPQHRYENGKAPSASAPPALRPSVY
jgi:hypothetical protein